MTIWSLYRGATGQPVRTKCCIAAISHFLPMQFSLTFQVTLKGVSGITDKSSKWTRLDLLICSSFLFVLLLNLYVNR